jgi:hypothetical protein
MSQSMLIRFGRKDFGVLELGVIVVVEYVPYYCHWQMCQGCSFTLISVDQLVCPMSIRTYSQWMLYTPGIVSSRFRQIKSPGLQSRKISSLLCPKHTNFTVFFHSLMH